jgi:hypothetical protein
VAPADHTGTLEQQLPGDLGLPEGAITGTEAFDLGLTQNAASATGEHLLPAAHQHAAFGAARHGAPRLHRPRHLRVLADVDRVRRDRPEPVKTDQTFTNPFFNTTGLDPTAAGLKPFSYTINFAPGVAGNPFQPPPTAEPSTARPRATPAR